MVDHSKQRTIVVVDDERTFYHRPNPVGPSPLYVYLRTSTEALSFLARSWTFYWNRPDLQTAHIDELWLDHDLGGDDTIKPVVDFLRTLDFSNMTRSADVERPWIEDILVHSQNPTGAEGVVRTLSRTRFKVERASPLVVGEHLQ